MSHLPDNSADRKDVPVTTGVLDYFPNAIAAVAAVSKRGNDKHNPGEPLHWSRDKSNDHADCIGRHLIERGGFDAEGVRHSAQLAWRALANLEEELIAEGATPGQGTSSDAPTRCNLPNPIIKDHLGKEWVVVDHREPKHGESYISGASPPSAPIVLSYWMSDPPWDAMRAQSVDTPYRKIVRPR